jgi:hypothetical protein
MSAANRTHRHLTCILVHGQWTERLWGPPRLLPASLSSVKRPKRKADSPAHTVPVLRMNGSTPPAPNTPSRRARDKHYSWYEVSNAALSTRISTAISENKQVANTRNILEQTRCVDCAHQSLLVEMKEEIWHTRVLTNCVPFRGSLVNNTATFIYVGAHCSRDFFPSQQLKLYNFKTTTSIQQNVTCVTMRSMVIRVYSVSETWNCVCYVIGKYRTDG